MALAKAREIVSSNRVVIFCERRSSYSVCVKRLFFLKLGAPYKAIQLDEESDGREIQSALAKWTGQLTLPCVFIGGKHIGGCETTWDLHKEGKLVPLLTQAHVATPLARAVTKSPPQDEFSRPTRKKKQKREEEFGVN